MREVVDAVARRAAGALGCAHDRRVGPGRRGVAGPERTIDDLAPFSRGEGPGAPVRLPGRLAEAGVHRRAGRRPSANPTGCGPRSASATDVLQLRKLMRGLDLVTVCEEAGCPNLSECWADGTATFMINGEQCTRACGFCLVDTSKPRPLDPGEPERVAEAVERLGLRFAVVTAVARDDLADGGAAAFAATIRAIRRRVPGCSVEVLIPDCKGDPEALATIFDARPDVLNHNIETVARLQRAVRPSASYARSLGVLARGQGGRPGHQELDHRGHGRDRRRGACRPWPTWPPSASTSSTVGPVPAAHLAPPAGRPLGGARRVRALRRSGRGARPRPRRGVTADPFLLPRPAGVRRGRGRRSSLPVRDAWPWRMPTAARADR